MVKRTSATLLLLICTMVLAGCGQKGPLHLPEEREQTNAPAEQTLIPDSGELSLAESVTSETKSNTRSDVTGKRKVTEQGAEPSTLRFQ